MLLCSRDMSKLLGPLLTGLSPNIFKEVSEHPDLHEETNELEEPEDESDEEADTPQHIQDSFFNIRSDSAIRSDPTITNQRAGDIGRRGGGRGRH